MSLASLTLMPLLLCASPSGEAVLRFEPVTNSAEYDRIMAELDSNTKFDFVDISLQEAAINIANAHGINIVIDDSSIRSSRSANAQEHLNQLADNISLVINNVRLRSALKILLDPLNLDYTVEEEVLKITSPEYVRQHQSSLAYDVTPLLQENDIKNLAEAIRESLPESLEGSARISGYRNVLLVTGNREVQASVVKSLRLINSVIRSSEKQTAS